MVNQVRSWYQNLALLGFILTLVAFSYNQKNLVKENSVLQNQMVKMNENLSALGLLVQSYRTEIDEQALNNVRRDKQIVELKEETVSLGQVLVEVIDNTEKREKVAAEKEEMPPVELLGLEF